MAKDRDAFFEQGASADQVTHGATCLPHVVEGEAERLRIVYAAQQGEPLFEPGERMRKVALFVRESA